MTRLPQFEQCFMESEMSVAGSENRTRTLLPEPDFELAFQRSKRYEATLDSTSWWGLARPVPLYYPAVY